MKALFPCFLLVFVSPVAVAAPVYLACTTSSEKEAYDFSVTLDEQTGEVSQTDKLGNALKADGFFGPNEITYQFIKSSQYLTERKQFRIDRTTLSASFTFRLEPNSSSIAASEIIYNGKCAIVKAPDRKI